MAVTPTEWDRACAPGMTQDGAEEELPRAWQRTMPSAQPLMTLSPVMATHSEAPAAGVSALTVCKGVGRAQVGSAVAYSWRQALLLERPHVPMPLISASR